MKLFIDDIKYSELMINLNLSDNIHERNINIL